MPDTTNTCCSCHHDTNIASGANGQPPDENWKLLLELMKSTTDITMTLSRTQPTEQAQFEMVRGVRCMADATRALAEAAYVEARSRAAETTARIAAGCNRSVAEDAANAVQSTGNTARALGLGDLEIGSVSGRVDNRVLVVNGPPGSITLQEWEAMSDEKLQRLDGALRNIVQRICIFGINWEAIGKIIDEELAPFGFAAEKDIPVNKASWDRVADGCSSDLGRIISMMDCCRNDCTDKWYPNEMLQVVRRLMELRSFKV